MRRRALLPVALAGLVVLSGCAGLLGGGSIPDDELDAQPDEPYAWDASADAHITITENAEFRAVYRVNGSEIELYRRDGFGGRNPIPVSALRYRYPNGTTLTGSELDAHGGGIERTRDEVTVSFPTDGPDEGRLAFTSSSTPKRFSLPVFVEGSYVVALPEGRSVDVPVFGSRSPGGSTVETVDGVTVIRWSSVDSRSVVVQFYLERDLTIFGAVAALLAVVGVAGGLYYRRRIEALRERRRDLGLDVELDDDRGDEPPPGTG